MVTRRDFIVGASASGALLARSGIEMSSAAERGVRISGPIVGGHRDRIFGAYFGDLRKEGYVEEEYFIAGSAQRYRPVGALANDGRWDVQPEGSAPYKTRVILHRPKDPTRFNGTVICEWTNVSAGFEISNAVNEGFHKQGYAYAAISAQQVGLEGFPAQSGLGLKRWDPARYGSLHIVGDSYSYDIFTQVAQSLAGIRTQSAIHPMAGFKVKHLIAFGESQSAARLTSYVNAIQPRSRAFSAFLIAVHLGDSTEFSDFAFDARSSLAENNDRRRALMKAAWIRDDLRSPILVLNSETEVMYSKGRPQPDGERFRVWEVAGAVHSSALGDGYRPDISARDGLPPMFTHAAKMVNLMPTMEAAAGGLIGWIEGGPPLRRQPRILVDEDTKKIARDANGNAIGGTRLPEIAVPTATYDTEHPPGFGARRPFPAEKLRALYPSDRIYRDLVAAATQRAQLEGLILSDRAEEYEALAKSF